MNIKPNRKNKAAVKAWCPKMRHIFWVNWIHTNKATVTQELNRKYAGWKEEGMKIVPVRIREI